MEKLKNQVNQINENYLFFAKKINETTKRKNIENIIINKDINKDINNIEIIYKNKNIKVLLKNCILNNTTNQTNDDFFKKNIEGYNLYFIILISILLIINFLAFPPFIIISIIIGGVILGLLGINPISIILIISVGIIIFIKYILNILVKFFIGFLSFLSEKLFKKDYISILLFKLSNIYNFRTFRKLLKKIYKPITKINYDDTYLSSNYLLDTNKIHLLYSDNKEIEFPKNIDKLLKYRIGKQIYKTTTILNKFYNIYNKIENLIKKEKKERQQQINEIQKKILELYNPKVENLETEYKNYVDTNNEINKIIDNLRKVYKQPENIEIFDKIDILISNLNEKSLKLKLLNERVKTLYIKLDKIENLLKNIDKTNYMYITKKLVFFYYTYFRFIVGLNTFKSSYVKNKIIEIDNKLNKNIQSFKNNNKKIKQEIKENKKQYKEKINNILKDIKQTSKEIIKNQSEIRLLEKKLKNSI